MAGFTYRLYLENGEGIGSFATAVSERTRGGVTAFPPSSGSSHVESFSLLRWRFLAGDAAPDLCR